MSVQNTLVITSEDGKTRTTFEYDQSCKSIKIIQSSLSDVSMEPSVSKVELGSQFLTSEDFDLIHDFFVRSWEMVFGTPPQSNEVNSWFDSEE